MTADAKAPSRWYRANLWVHCWASLVATLPFLILCLTGTVLIFHEEIDAAMGVTPPAPGLSDTNHPLASAVTNALSTWPAEKVMLLGMDAEDHPGLLLVGTAPTTDVNFDNMTLRFAHLSTGELVPENFREDQTLTGFLLKLHPQWFLGAAAQS